VPPIKALPVIPKPPQTKREPVVDDDEFIFPPIDTPVPVNCKLAFSLTELVVEA